MPSALTVSQGGFNIHETISRSLNLQQIHQKNIMSDNLHAFFKFLHRFVCTDNFPVNRFIFTGLVNRIAHHRHASNKKKAKNYRFQTCKSR